MKNTLHIAILAIGVSAACLPGCAKEELAANDGTSMSSSSGATQRARSYRIFSWDCGGQPGCPNPEPICHSSGGNCLPDVVIVGAALQQLDDAIINRIQEAFFKRNKYSEVLRIPHEERIQQGLARGVLVMVPATHADKKYYYVVKSMDAGLKGEALMEKVELVIPVIVE